MRFANIVTTGVEPQICVTVSLTVLLAVVKYALENVGNGTVVASTVARSQNHNVAVAGSTCIAIPAGVVWHLPVPLWLRLEVARLGLIVLCWCRQNRLSRRVVSVIADRYVAEEFEEDHKYCEYRDRSYYGSG